MVLAQRTKALRAAPLVHIGAPEVFLLRRTRRGSGWAPRPYCFSPPWSPDGGRSPRHGSEAQLPTSFAATATAGGSPLSPETVPSPQVKSRGAISAQLRHGESGAFERRALAVCGDPRCGRLDLRLTHLRAQHQESPVVRLQDREPGSEVRAQSAERGRAAGAVHGAAASVTVKDGTGGAHAAPRPARTTSPCHGSGILQRPDLTSLDAQPPHGDLGDAESESASQGQDLHVEGEAFGDGAVEEQLGHRRPERLEAALGVVERHPRQGVDQSVEGSVHERTSETGAIHRRIPTRSESRWRCSTRAGRCVNWGVCAGSIAMSASANAMSGPRAAATPARTAPPFPRFCVSRTCWTWGKRAKRARAHRCRVVGAAVVDHDELGGLHVDGAARRWRRGAGRRRLRVASLRCTRE